MTGKDGFANKRKLDHAAQVAKERAASRFWLKPGEEAVIIFLDTNPFFIYEHNLKLGGKYGNYFSCRKQMGICPIEHTDSNLKPTYTGYLSIIDRREYTVERQGKVENRKDTRKLIPIKGTAIMVVEDLIKKHGDLTGRAFIVKRYTKDDPNCGIAFELVGKKIDLVKNFGRDGSAPFDYMKVLKPPTDEELSVLGFTVSVAGSAKDLAQEPQGNVNIPAALRDLV
jgi:hypothetical protein